MSTTTTRSMWLQTQAPSGGFVDSTGRPLPDTSNNTIAAELQLMMERAKSLKGEVTRIIMRTDVVLWP